MRRFAFFLFLVSSVFTQELYSQNSSLLNNSLDEGFYRTDKSIKLSYPDAGVEILYRFNENINQLWTVYDDPFQLNAMTDEERRYTFEVKGIRNGIEIFLNSYLYIIDKHKPSLPEVNYPPDIYNKSITIKLSSPSGDRIFYSLNNSLTEGQKEFFNGEEIDLEGNSLQMQEYTILTYSKDTAGNLSKLEKYKYTISKQTPVEKKLLVVSPLPGEYSNKQLLFIKKSGFEWIKYSINNPESESIEYSYPFLIPYTDEVTVYISAKKMDRETIIEKTISFTVNENNEFALDMVSGIYQDDLTVKFPGKVYLDKTSKPLETIHYFHVENSVTENKLVYSPVENSSLKYSYFYIIDNRKPYTPAILTEQTPPINQNTLVSIITDEYSQVYYTKDGSTPDQTSLLYKGPFLLKLPADIEQGSYIIKAKSFSINGLSSIEVSKLILFDVLKPGRPDLSVSDKNSYTKTLTAKNTTGDGTIYFEISNSVETLKTPDTSSAVFSTAKDLSVPKGAHQSFIIQMITIDNAGNSSDLYISDKITIDRLSPPPPEFTIEDQELILTGDGVIYYSFTSDGSIPAPASINSKEYSTAIKLAIKNNFKNRFLVKAIAVDANNNQSFQSEVFEIIADTRISTAPELTGVENGGIYNTDVIASLKDENEKFQYFYTIDGSTPDSSSSKYEKSITVPALSGEEKQIILKIAGQNKITGIYSVITTVSFTIDQIPPKIPEFTDLPEITTTNRDVTIDPPDINDKNTVYYSLSELNKITDSTKLIESRKKLSSPLIISGNSRDELQFFLRIWNEDQAGNQSSGKNTYTIIMDKSSPVSPLISTYSDTNSNDVFLEISAEEGAEIFYEMTADNSNPAVPGINSKQYKSPIRLSEKLNAEYRYYAIAVDSFGNISNPSKIVKYSFLTDTVPSPEAPSIDKIQGMDRLLIFSWNIEADYELFYSIEYQNSSANTFQIYTDPLELILPDYQNNVKISYFYQSQDGSKSSIKESSVNIKSASASIISGVSDNGFYNTKVKITKNNKINTVKYEITSETVPPLISEFSPVMPDTLSFDVPEGETVTYTLRLNMISTQNSKGMEEIITFTIDKSAPSPPVLNGVVSKAYFQDQAVLDFSDFGENSVYYQVSNNSRETSAVFSKYTQPVLVQPKENDSELFIVKAYTEDEAGNRSRTKNWEIIIENQVVYVSENGSDANDGSRDNPFRSLSQAVSFSLLTGRKSIYLAEGIYDMSEIFELNKTLEIVGGLDQNKNWQRSDQISSKINFSSYNASFIVNEGNVTFSNILFTNSYKGSSEYIFLKTGYIEIENVTFTKKDSTTALIFKQAGGSAVFNNSKVQLDNTYGGDVIKIKSGIFSSSGSTFAGSNSEKPLIIFNVEEQSKLVLDTCKIYPGAGQSTSAVTIKNSSMTVNNTFITSGTGTRFANILDASFSNVTISKSELQSSKESRISTLINSINSNISIEESLIENFSEVGSLFINARNGKISVARNKINFKDTDEFIYLFKGSSTEFIIHNNGIFCASTSDFSGITANDSSVEFIHNTIITSDADGLNKAFDITNNKKLVILNNVIIMNGVDKGTAITINGSLSNIDIRANNVFGFKNILSINERNYVDFASLTAGTVNYSSMHISENMQNSLNQVIDVINQNYYPKNNSALRNRAVKVKSKNFAENDYLGNTRPNETSYQKRSDIGYIEMGP